MGVFNEFPTSGQIPPEDASFSELFQQQTSSMLADTSRSERPGERRVQAGEETGKLDVNDEVVEAFARMYAPTTNSSDLGMVSTPNVRFFQTVQGENAKLGENNQEPSASDAIPNLASEETVDIHGAQAGERPFPLVASTAGSSGFLEEHSLTGGVVSPERQGGTVSAPVVGVDPIVTPIPHPLPHSTALQTTTEQSSNPPISSKAPLDLPDHGQVLSSEPLQKSGRFGLSDFREASPIELDMGPLSRRLVSDQPSPSLVASLARPTFASRSFMADETFAPSQAFELPGVFPLPGGTSSIPIRSDGGGGVAGGTAAVLNEAMRESGGASMDVIKPSGDGDLQGLGSEGNHESGLQSGLSGFSHSQSGQQQASPHAGPMGNGIRHQEEVTPELPTQPLQRLQLDVQISETQRVQIDVGVQHRQVYAGLVMDQAALKNLAMQFVPQLEEQLSHHNLELDQFSAETWEDPGAEAGSSSYQRDRSESKESEGSGRRRSWQASSLSHQGIQREVGLHFVA